VVWLLTEVTVMVARALRARVVDAAPLPGHPALVARVERSFMDHPPASLCKEVYRSPRDRNTERTSRALCKILVASVRPGLAGAHTMTERRPRQGCGAKRAHGEGGQNPGHFNASEVRHVRGQRGRQLVSRLIEETNYACILHAWIHDPVPWRDGCRVDRLRERDDDRHDEGWRLLWIEWVLGIQRLVGIERLQRLEWIVQLVGIEWEHEPGRRNRSPGRRAWRKHDGDRMRSDDVCDSG
jgi:hypothetical protein